MSELDLLKSEFSAITQVIEGTVIEIDETEATLADLLNESRRLQAEYTRKVREIENKRNHLKIIKAENKERQRQAEIREMQIRAEEESLRAANDITGSLEKRRNYAMEKGFNWTKFALPHQWQGALTLSHFGNAMLADTMGLGKTLTSIAYLDMLSYERDGRMEFGAKKVLVIVPNDLVSEFGREFRQWAPHRSVLPIAGANANVRNMVNHVLNDVDNVTVVINYESLRLDHSWITDIHWDAVIIDEFHNAKDSDGTAFDRIKRIDSTYFLPMTATFILNSPEDIFPALNLIMPDTFNDIKIYRSVFCSQDYRGKWTFQHGGEKALMTRVGARLVKRSLSDAGVELPRKTEHDIIIGREDISERQWQVMKDVDDALIAVGDSSYPIQAAIAQITRQRQAACYPAGIEIKMTEADYNIQKNWGMNPVPVGTTLLKVPDDVPSVKIDMAVERLVRITKAGKRAVVFSQFKTALVALEKRLNDMGIRAVRFDGDTKEDLRNLIKRDFKRTNDERDNEPSRWDVVLCNYKTGGVGLTLTRATYLLKLDEEWNPGKTNQATARIWRIGQTEPVLIETMRVDKSVDMWMKSLLEMKQAIVDGLDNEVDMSIMDSYREFMGAPQPKKVEAKKAVDLSEYDDILEGF